MVKIAVAVLAILLMCMPATAAEANEPVGYDINSQLDILGRDRLMESIPGDAGELMEEAGLYELSAENILHLSPGDFFRVVWGMVLEHIKSPFSALGIIVGIIILCAFLNGIKTAAWNDSLSEAFDTVAVLCVVLSAVKPVLDCVTQTVQSIKEASFFMMGFVPVFSAAVMASGQPAAGATYNMFLFSACQVVSQLASQILLPLIGVYLALCIMGSLVKGIDISSAAGAVRSVATWSLGFILTLFVGFLSLQSIVGTSADSLTSKTAKFLIGSFVPVVGGALSDAYTAARGCLALIKTSVGAYGIIVAVFTFLPSFLKLFAWYAAASIGAVAGDIMGVKSVAAVLKSCAAVLGILMAIVLCYALLIIVSITILLMLAA